MHFRGPILVHTGKSRAWIDPGRYRGTSRSETARYGALLGVVDVIDCLHIYDIEDSKHDSAYPWIADHPPNGEFCIVPTNVRRLVEPIPCNGSQGI